MEFCFQITADNGIVLRKRHGGAPNGEIRIAPKSPLTVTERYFQYEPPWLVGDSANTK